jgi:hypothetical protein
VRLDGRAVQVVDVGETLFSWQLTLHAPRGLHRVAVVATDRAGNRGRAASARVRVR